MPKSWAQHSEQPSRARYREGRSLGWRAVFGVMGRTRAPLSAVIHNDPLPLGDSDSTKPGSYHAPTWRVRANFGAASMQKAPSPLGGEGAFFCVYAFGMSLANSDPRTSSRVSRGMPLKSLWRR
jgi:hypothetical protein